MESPDRDMDLGTSRGGATSALSAYELGPVKGHVGLCWAHLRTSLFLLYFQQEEDFCHILLYSVLLVLSSNITTESAKEVIFVASSGKNQGFCMKSQCLNPCFIALALVSYVLFWEIR